MKDFIYLSSFEISRQSGELDLYRENASKNSDCLAAIDKAISDCNYELYRYDTKAALDAVTKDFSLDRVAYLMAGVVQQHSYEGRYSHTNKAWAQACPIGDTKDMVLSSHPAVLDGFIDTVRKAQLQMVMTAPEQIEGVRDISASTIEVETAAYVRGMLMEAGINGVEVVGAKVYGSRAHEGESCHYSDLDVVVEYRGNLREDDFFSMLHEGDGLEFGGVGVDINPITEGKSGTLAQFMVQDHFRRMELLQEKQLTRMAEEKENPLKAAEMSSEQNYNMIDGIPNNEPPRMNQGYAIIDSEIVGKYEVVLGENLNAPSPYVTWERNLNNDAESGVENFFWGHYMGKEETARDDFSHRVADRREECREERPSILSQLKENAASCSKQSAAPHKDIPER